MKAFSLQIAAFQPYKTTSVTATLLVYKLRFQRIRTDPRDFKAWERGTFAVSLKKRQCHRCGHVDPTEGLCSVVFTFPSFWLVSPVAKAVLFLPALLWFPVFYALCVFWLRMVVLGLTIGPQGTY